MKNLREMLRPHPGSLPLERERDHGFRSNEPHIRVLHGYSRGDTVSNFDVVPRAPSPGGVSWGEGGSRRSFAFAGIVALALVILTGCGDKPAAKAPETEVRGQPIAPVTASGSEAGPAVPAAKPPAAETPAPVPPPATPPPPAPAASGAAYAMAGFDILSGYSIEISDELLGPVTNDLAAVTAKTEALIPEKVRALNEKKVALKGFMLPLKVEGGLVTEMLIMKDQSMCCYGTVPKIHEWVSVKMSDKGVKPVMDQTVTLMGKLHVGEMRENGYLTGIYSMDGEKMSAEGN